MTFKVTTALKKLLNMTARKRIVQGGSSSAKTFSIIPILIDKAIKEEGREISIVSESIPHLKRGAYKDFLKIMMSLGRFNDNSLNKTDMKYTFSNGSYIEFFSVEQSDKLRGARRTDLYVNEANNVSFESYKQLAMRTSGDIWIDFNPTNRFWAHTEVLPEADSELIKLTYKDNEALPKSIISEIESARDKAEAGSEYWLNWWNVYGLGEIGSLQGACITEWSVIDELPKHAKLICAGLDFGYTNDHSSLIALYKYNNEYIFHEVFYKRGMLNSDISNEMSKVEGLDEVVTYADSSEPKSIAELSLNHNVEGVKKGKDSVVYGVNLINQTGIKVTAQSKNLINELQNYVWKITREGVTLNVPVDSNNHGIDAGRYALVSVLENKHRGEYHIW